RQEIATQQAEVELRASIRQADAASKAEALSILKTARQRLEDNEDINADRKKAMLRMVNDRIRMAELATKISIEQSENSPKAQARKADAEKQLAISKKIRDELTEINRLDGAGLKE